MEGIVKRYYSDRGFGFISVPGEKDVYFHVSEVGDESDTLNFYVGDPVSFEMGRDKKRPDNGPECGAAMITVRGMQGVTSDSFTRRAAQPQPKQPAQIVTVRRKISTQPRDLFATVTLEAFDESAGVVVRTESFRVAQPLTNSTIISRKLEFCDALAADGYAVKI